MTKKISPKIFFDSDKILDFDQFAVDDVFSLLGKSLQEKIAALLSQFDVKDSPVIHGEVHPSAVIEGAVYIAEGAVVGPGAYIQGPTFIDKGAEVRHAAFIRGNAIIGPKAVVGHTTEVKGSVFGPGAKAGHFAYVGDSLLGENVNLGAGTKLANLKLKGDEVKVKSPVDDQRIGSGLRKFGAILGKNVQTGCNSVLSPGSLLLPDTAVLPCVHFHGTLKKGFAR